MERLFLYYRGKKIQQMHDKHLKDIDNKSICVLDSDSLIVNHFQGEHNTSRQIIRPNFRLWMHGIYVHKDKGISVCVNEELFQSVFSGEPKAAEIPGLFVNGAYIGFVIENERIYVFNDFMGLQPVYHYHEKGELLVCSSLQFLLRAVSTTTDREALAEFALTGNMYTGKTAAKEIMYMGPASLLTIGKNWQIHLCHYSPISERSEIRRRQEDVVDDIVDRFKKAVTRAHDSNIKYSLSMTGGIDSRLVYLEWPDKQNLLCETAGEGTSDFLKARQIIECLGNPQLHELEQMFPEKYADGIDNYYKRCDNPLRVLGDFSSYHLDWKMSRGSFIHMSGVGGELLDGENLYLSRSRMNVIKEGVSSYTYHELREYDKAKLLGNVLGMGNKTGNLRFLAEGGNSGFDFQELVNSMDSFIGKTKYQECYTERFRTLFYATSGYHSFGSLNLAKYLILMPYNDMELIKAVFRYHPSSRELRKMTISMLRRYSQLKDIPVDTTHLKIDSPYVLHRFFRVMRMVLGIGFHKKIPIIQKGDPPKFRIFPYFDGQNRDFRELVNKRLLDCSWFDRRAIQMFIDENTLSQKYNFFTHHGSEANMMILLRMTYMKEMLNG